jgi:hypothetical protein
MGERMKKIGEFKNVISITSDKSKKDGFINGIYCKYIYVNKPSIDNKKKITKLINSVYKNYHRIYE